MSAKARFHARGSDTETPDIETTAISSEHEQDIAQGIQDSCEYHQGRRMQLHDRSSERPTLIHSLNKSEAHQSSPDAEEARRPSISPQPHRQMHSGFSHIARD